MTAIHLFVHLNLSISLLLGYLIFMIGIETARSTTVSTIIIIGVVAHDLHDILLLSSHLLALKSGNNPIHKEVLE